MRTFKIPNREQLLMLQRVNLESVAPVGSPLRAIDELVDQLDTSKIEETYDFESPQGATPLHPKTLIKVALYAMHNCRFSLRKIEEDTILHLGYQWITGNDTIDHSTMGKFLSKHKLALPELFSQVVMIGMEHELIDFEVLNIDTVKIRANASYKQFKTHNGIIKEQEKLKEKLAKLIEESCCDDDEQKVLLARHTKLENAKKELDKRIGKKSKNISKKKGNIIEEKERINVTDPDCSLMQQANGEKNSSYAITMATDSANDFITYAEVQDTLNDAEALLPAIEGSRNITGNRHEVVNSDAGFSSIENLEELEEDNQFALMPDRRFEIENRGKTAKGKYDRSKFTYNDQKDYYICPQGSKLKKIAEVKIKKNRIQYRYGNKTACEKCRSKNQCTKGKYRIVSRDSNEAVKERMRERLGCEKNKEKYKLRAHSIESPFGHIKHNLKFRIFMRRGWEKIKMEILLLSMLHNMLRINRKTYYGT